MRDVGNHETREWTWRDVVRDPVVWIMLGCVINLIVAVLVVFG